MPPLRELPRGHPADGRRHPRAARARRPAAPPARLAPEALVALRALRLPGQRARAGEHPRARVALSGDEEIGAEDLHLAPPGGDAERDGAGAGHRVAARLPRQASSARRSSRRSSKTASTAPPRPSCSASPSARCATACSAWASRGRAGGMKIAGTQHAGPNWRRTLATGRAVPATATSGPTAPGSPAA